MFMAVICDRRKTPVWTRLSPVTFLPPSCHWCGDLTSWPVLIPELGWDFASSRYGCLWSHWRQDKCLQVSLHQFELGLLGLLGLLCLRHARWSGNNVVLKLRPHLRLHGWENWAHDDLWQNLITLRLEQLRDFQSVWVKTLESRCTHERDTQRVEDRFDGEDYLRMKRNNRRRALLNVFFSSD